MNRTKKPISINILSTMDSVELVCLSEDNDIASAGSVSFGFDASTREIQDVEEFKNALKTLYESNGVPLNSPTNLILPSYLTREFEIPGSGGPGNRNVAGDQPDGVYPHHHSKREKDQCILPEID